jgi:uncharacterized protein (TIRG00374 family)
MRLPIDVGRKELVWFGVTGVLFALLLYFADLQKFVTSFRQADPTWFAAAFVVGFSSLLVWAWVWHRFFGELGIVSSPSRTVRMFLTGHFLNSITPLGQFGGEPIMAYIVSDTTGTDYERALAGVVSADILNAAPFFTFTLGGVLYLAIFESLNGIVLQVGVISIVLLVVGLVLAYLLWSDDSTLGEAITGVLAAIERRAGRAEGIVRGLKESVDNVEEAFQEAGNDPAFLLKTTAISHLAILAQIVSLYFVFLSIGVTPEFVPIYFIVNLSVIATLSPTPGGAGTYEAAFAGLVTVFFSVDFATALTAAVLFRLTTYWPGLLVGYPSLLTLNRSGTAESVEGEL